jgi:hypothetical protein
MILNWQHLIRLRHSNFAHQKQDDQNKKNQAHPATRTIPPIPAMRPRGERTEQHQNEQNDQYGSYRHKITFIENTVSFSRKKNYTLNHGVLWGVHPICIFFGIVIVTNG